MLPDTTEFVDNPVMAVSFSEGVTGLQRRRSVRQLGNLPGDEAEKRPLDKKRVEKQFVKLINKFMRIE